MVNNQPVNPLRVMEALDACRGVVGPLSAERRALVWQAIDTADDTEWLAARTILITADKTLWQAVAAEGTAPNHTPPPARILSAIPHRLAPTSTKNSLKDGRSPCYATINSLHSFRRLPSSCPAARSSTRPTRRTIHPRLPLLTPGLPSSSSRPYPSKGKPRRPDTPPRHGLSSTARPEPTPPTRRWATMGAIPVTTSSDGISTTSPSKPEQTTARSSPAVSRTLTRASKSNSASRIRWPCKSTTSLHWKFLDHRSPELGQSHEDQIRQRPRKS